MWYFWTMHREHPSEGLRPGLANLLDLLEDGGALTVTKMDSLGRNAMDVRVTVEKLTKIVVRVHCLTLGDVDPPLARPER